jgi:hypothetical protein
MRVSSAQLGYLLPGIDWRHPHETWRPTAPESLPTDFAAAHAMILAEHAARVKAEAVAASAQAEAASERPRLPMAQADLSSTDAFINLEIEKLQRQLYGTRSERKARLLEQMELQLDFA